MIKKQRKGVLSKFIICIFAVLIILPLLTIVMWAFAERMPWPDLLPQKISLRAFQEITGRSGEMSRLMLSSIGISLAVGVLSVVIGMMSAQAFVFYEFPGKKLLFFSSVLPFLVPATVFAMGIQITFIKLGLNNSITGVILVHLVCSLPYAVRLLSDGMTAVGERLSEQARVLGAGAFQAFVKVTLPMLLPVILSAFSMAYIVSFSQYFLTLLIGGGEVKTFTIVMVPYLSEGGRNMASVYSLVFLGITILVFGGFEWLILKWGQEQDIEYYG